MNIAWKEMKKNKGRFLILGSIVFLVSLLTFIISGLANGLSQDNAALIKDFPNGNIEISLEQRGQSVCVTFNDTGIGMSNSEIERSFERFYRADKARTRTIDGTGLGLSIVKTIVDLHGGSIQVSSKENEGTTFIVELPA